MTRSLLADERFVRKLVIHESTGCWLWHGYRNDKGYGQVRVAGRGFLAHRYSWLRLVGPIPKGKELDHLCRNRSCVNPDHLELVTHQENLRRGNSPSGVNARKTHCKRGHALRPENLWLFVREDGGVNRQCRTCGIERSRRRRVAERRAA